MPFRTGRPFRLALLACLAPLAACGKKDPTPPVFGGGGGGGTPVQRPSLPITYRPTGRAAAGDAFVHLFEWKWTDIATECETVLAPAGYRAVQISPPQEHIVLPQHQWWTRYQPVSYRLDRSRSGTRAELEGMISRCRAVNVDIYVDAVINHMSAGSGTGSAGTAYTKYEYPGLYTRTDFHSGCGITNYQSAANVQDCELVGLSDLKTESPAVREKIAAYLTGLARMGVAGFRIDAAKHIQPVQLDSIVTLVHQTLAAEQRPLPYWFAEVIDNGGEAVSALDYFGLGYASGGAVDITEFRWRFVGDRFLGGSGSRLADLRQVPPPGASLLPSDKAVVFLENHDTQRGGGISYRDGDVYRLAHVFMLGHPYGYPSVMSSYAFDRNSQPGDDMGPPSDAQGNTNAVSCAARMEQATIGQWACEHRDPTIRAMVGFRRAVAGTDLRNWWDDGANAIAFSRGDRGFVAINRNATPVTATIATALPAGRWCDVLTGGLGGNGDCASRTVTVAADGSVTLTLASNTAVALHAGARP